VLGSGLPAGLFQDLVQLVQLLLERGEFCLLRPEFLNCLRFFRFPFLFSGFLRLQLPLRGSEHHFHLFAFGGVLGIVQFGFSTFDLRGRVRNTRPNFGKLGMNCIQALLRASDDRLLKLRAIDKNLNSLRGNGRGLQILPELAHFTEQRLESLRVC